MNSVEFTPDQSQFLSRFFGPGNVLKWDAYVAGTMAASSRDLLAPLIEDYRQGNVPALLPRVSETTPPSIQWYAIAHHAREASSLREQLTAFIGPTYTDFTGQLATLDQTDSVESAIIERFSPYVFRLRVLKVDDREKVRNKILLMRSLRSRHPDRTAELVRPVGRLLRDLEMALVVRNESSAWQCLDDLRARGRMSAHNLAFLKVRILANFDRWKDVLDLPETNSLATIHRPANVTHALIQANYNVYMAEYERNSDVDGIVQRYRELEPSFGTLFRARGETRAPTVLKAFLVRSVAAVPTDPESVRALIDEYPSGDSGRGWVDALASFALAQPDVESEPRAKIAVTAIQERAREACEKGDFDNAFQLLLECEASVATVRQLLACSIEIDSLEAARRSLEFIEQCPCDVRDAALSMRVFRQMWEDLTRQTAPDATQPSIDMIPEGWIPWIDRLNSEGVWPAAAEIARHGAVEWSIEDLRLDPDRVSHFAALLISARPANAEAILRNAIPDLLKHFLPDGKAQREFKSIYLNLAYVLALDDSINADDLSALATLTESILECAPTKDGPDGSNEFQEIVDTLEIAWNHVAAPRHIDWALQIVDVLIAFNVGAYAPVDQLLNEVLNAFRTWPRRVRPDQWGFLEQLLADIGQECQLIGLRPEEATLKTGSSSLQDQLSGKSIAIYTLTERIGHRAGAAIASCFTGVKLQLLHDHNSTDRLEQLARNADVFIVNTWDAKHAATIAIHACRPKQSVTLFPQSKSAGSILRAVYDYLHNSYSKIGGGKQDD